MNKHYEANKLRSNRKAYRHIFLYAALLSTVAVIGATKVYADDTKDSEAKSELVATAPETNQLDQVSQDQTVQATDDQVQANQTKKAAEEKAEEAADGKKRTRRSRKEEAPAEVAEKEAPVAEATEEKAEAEA